VQAQSPPPLPHPRWAPVPEHFPLLAIGDGSTLEALRKKTAVLRERTGLVLVGKMMVLVEAFSHRPLCQVDTEDAAANDKRFAAEFLAALPVGGLLVFDLGFFSFLWCDDSRTSSSSFGRFYCRWDGCRIGSSTGSCWHQRCC
jgi:hypothetical protein